MTSRLEIKRNEVNNQFMNNGLKIEHQQAPHSRKVLIILK